MALAPLAVGSTVAVLAVIGLVIGLVVLLVVIGLLNGTLAPLRRILVDVQSAQTAPMLERGVPGTDQLGQTRRLAESVPELALAYLQKLSRGVSSAPPAASPAPPAPSAAPSAPSTAPPAVSTEAPAQAQTAPEPPAWHKYRS